MFDGIIFSAKQVSGTNRLFNNYALAPSFISAGGVVGLLSLHSKNRRIRCNKKHRPFICIQLKALLRIRVVLYECVYNRKIQLS